MTTRQSETVQQWVTALEGMGRQVKQQSSYWMAQCPAHDDGNPSMRIKDKGDGTAAIECYAGCDYVDILKAVGFYGTRSDTAAANQATEPVQRQKPAKEPSKPQRLPNRETDTRYDYVDENGKLRFVVIRHDWPGKAKAFSQWIPSDEDGAWLPTAPTGQRPLFRLPDALKTTGSVGITEGEKCCQALRDAWPNKAVTTWAGGTNAWQLTDWTPLAGREVSLIADGDAPGHKAMEALAAHLYGLGCAIKIALPPVEWDSDVADWIADGGKEHAEKIIGEFLKDYNPPSAPEPEPEDELDIPPDEMRDNAYYRLIGLQQVDFAFWLKDEGQIHVVSRTKITRVEELISLAPDVFWRNLASTDKLNSEVCRAFGDSLTRIAAGLGQVDHSHTVGRGAVRLPDGKVAYHLGDRVLIDGVECNLNDNSDRVWLSGPPMDLGSPARADRVKDIARAVLQYRWASQDDGRRFLGWIVAAMVGGALEWRPHLWLTAPAGTGKTWLFDHVLLKLMGSAMLPLADASPAGVARFTGNASLPIGIDEAEPSQEWVAALLPMLRVASSGAGARVRADSHGGVSVQHSRFSAILSSTIAPNLAKADATRITEVGLSTDSVEDWPSVRRTILNAVKQADGVRYKIFREAQGIVHEADRLAGEMQD